MSTACFIGRYDIEQTASIMAEMQVKNVEVFLSCPSEYKSSFATTLKSVFDDCGIFIDTVHPFGIAFEPQLFSVYRRSREDAMETFLQVLKAARLMGAHAYTFHGPANVKGLKNFRIDYSFYGERTKELCRAAADEGICLEWENVYWASFSHPEFALRLLEYVDEPNLKFTLDLKQAAQSRINAQEYVAAMGDRLSNIHICDAVEQNGDIVACLPFQGTVDFSGVKQVLPPCRSAHLEVYAKNYADLSELKGCYENIKKFFK